MATTPLVTVCLPTRDLAAAARFYREGLGLPYTSEVAADTLPDHASVDAMVERAGAAGGSVVSEPAMHDWGYSATFEDLDGHLWMVTAAPHA